MIGFDRPIKPEWIYKTLLMIEPGEPVSKYNEPFETIVQELVGKEGIRKVRTIIFRSFVYSLQKSKTIIEPNIFRQWVQERSVDDLKPLFLAKILMDYPVARFVTQKIKQNTDQHRQFSSVLITATMVREYGDRDVVKRSVRSFLRTLENFGVLKKSEKNFAVQQKFTLTDEQIRDLLLLYSTFFIRSRSVDLSHIDPLLLEFFQQIDWVNTSKKYHGQNWEYVRDAGRDFLIVIVK